MHAYAAQCTYTSRTERVSRRLRALRDQWRIVVEALSPIARLRFRVSLAETRLNAIYIHVYVCVCINSGGAHKRRAYTYRQISVEFFLSVSSATVTTKNSEAKKKNRTRTKYYNRFQWLFETTTTIRIRLGLFLLFLFFSRSDVPVLRVRKVHKRPGRPCTPTADCGTL